MKKYYLIPLTRVVDLSTEGACLAGFSKEPEAGDQSATGGDFGDWEEVSGSTRKMRTPWTETPW